jgi:hypothetical protein
MKKCIAIIMLGIMVLSGSGCNKSTDLPDATTKGELRITQKVDNPDERLYKEIQFVKPAPEHLEFESKRKEEYPEYDLEIRNALVYQMERYKDEPDRTYHTLFRTLPSSLFSEEYIEELNEEYGLDMDISKWEEFTDGMVIGYYYLLTADEIRALADKDIICYYVGSGEGDVNKANIDTLEGINVYCELYGDQYIQYK